jgi:signal transduction histidine kinase
LPAQRRSGTQFIVELTISTSASNEGPLFTALLRDIAELVEAPDAANQSEQRFASLVANITGLITLRWEDGTWVSSTGAGLRLLGYEPGFELKGGIPSLLHPDDVAIADKALAEAVAGTLTSSDPIDLRVRAANGALHVFETVFKNLTDDPSVDGLVLTSRDVTNERARGVAKDIEALISWRDHADVGVVVANSHHEIVWANQTFCSIIGSTEDANYLIGQPTSILQTFADAMFADPEAFAVETERQLIRRSLVMGEEIALADGRTLQRDYIPIGAISERVDHFWLYADISQKKELDLTRWRLLEVERGLRGKAEEQARILQGVADLKTELVAMVSHELRTPLTSIVSFADLLLNDEEPKSETEQKEFLTVIDRNAKRLIRVVDDLLLLGQLESGITLIQPTVLPVNQIVEWAVESATHLSNAAGVAIRTSIEPGPALHADSYRLGQVLDNLLSNAIKFSDGGGNIEVTARHHRDRWVFAVVDDGVGISEADQEQLFDSFFRASGTAQSTPGTGLGLAICKAIVELHGGTITVESQQDYGARFEFVIPDEREMTQ